MWPLFTGWIGHPRERQNMVFIEKWSFFKGYFLLYFSKERVIEVWPLFTGWTLFGIVMVALEYETF